MHVHQTPTRVKSCTHVAWCSPSSCTFTRPQRELSRALMFSRAHMLHDVHKTPTQSSHAWTPNAWDGKRSASMKIVENKGQNTQLSINSAAKIAGIEFPRCRFGRIAHPQRSASSSKVLTVLPLTSKRASKRPPRKLFHALSCFSDVDVASGATDALIFKLV